MKNNNMCTIYVVRHAQSVNNSKFEGGQEIFKKRKKLGSELTSLGIEQSKTLAQKFNNIHFDKVFSSDFTRARQTAEILVQEQKLEVITTKLIRERNWGSLDGKVTAKIKEKIKELQKGLSDLEKMRIKIVKDAESEEEAMSRLIKFLREISIAYKGKTLLVVCHGNIMRSLLVYLAEAKYDELPGGSFLNTGYIKMDSDETEFNVREIHGMNKVPIN